MIVLGIETATWVGSVALVDEKSLIGECTLNVKVTHSGRLLATIDHVLASSNVRLASVDALAVSLGPGSFTGLRIGMSTIKGLAWAGKKSVVGVPTLDALAYSCAWGGGVLCPMLDARKEEVFAAVYRMESPFVLEKLTADMALRPRKLLEDLPRFGEMQHSLGHTDAKVTFLGDGAERYRVLIEETLGSSAVFVPPHRSYPRAATIAFMGLAALKEGNVNDITTVTPRYVRPSDAERHYRGVT